MKKFLRLALVFALAGAALLYTGCTKDYESDIARINETIATNKSATETSIAAIEGRITELEKKISTLETARTNIEKSIADLQKAGTDASSRITALETAKASMEKDIADLKTLANNNKTAIEEIKAEMKNLATKKELADQKEELEGEISDLETKIAGEIETLKTDLEEKISALDTKLSGEINTLKGEINTIKSTYATNEALASSIQALENSISDLETLLGAVADRIQSITFVPEYNDGKATFVRYQLGGYSLTQEDNRQAAYVFVGTFEVCPASAVTKIVAENACLRVVPVESRVKGAQQGTEVPVVIDEYVGATGYVTVRASIPAPKDAQGKILPIFWRNDQDYAVSLLVFEDENSAYPTEIESPYVISSINLDDVHVEDEVYFTKDNQKLDASKIKIATKKIDYTDSLSYMEPNKYLAFEGYSYGIDIEGQSYTLPEAETFLGLAEGTLAPTYKDFARYRARQIDPVEAENDEFEDQAKLVHPYVISETGLDRKLQLKSVVDKGMYQFIGYKAVYGSSAIYVAGEETGLSLQASAIITKHQSDATVAAANIPWDYVNYEFTDALVEGLAVTNPDKNTFAAGALNESLIYVKGDETKTPVAGTVTFAQSGTDNVDASIVGVPCGDTEAITYVYEGEYETDSDLYMVSFEFTVAPRHLDCIIGYETTEPVSGNAKSEFKFDYKFIEEAIPTDDAASYYGALTEPEATLPALYTAFSSANCLVTNVTINGEEAEDLTPYSVVLGLDAENADASYISIAAGSLLYGATYKIEAEATVFGVEYSWIVSFVTAATPYGIEIIPGTFVDKNVISITATCIDYTYKINDCDLRQYVQAFKGEDDSFDDEDLEVSFSCTDPEVTAENAPVIPAFVGITPNVAPADVNKAKLAEPRKVEWADYDKLEMPVCCTLYVASTKQTLATLDLILKVSPDPIVKFEGSKKSYERTNNIKDLASAPIWNGYTVIGCLSEENIAATTASGTVVESGTAETGLTLVAPDHGAKQGIWRAIAINYTQVVKIAPITEWTVIDGLGNKTMFVDNTTNLKFDAATGIVTLLADQANLNGGSLKVTIPTTLSYQFGEDRTDTITVTYIQK